MVFRNLMVGSLILLSSCKVGPDFKNPIPPTNQTYTDKKSFISDKATQNLVYGKDIPGQWWALFQSPALNQLIEQALKHNPNLQAAEAALTEAQENALTQQGALFPSVDASFADRRQNVSGALFGNPNAGSSLFTLYNASVEVSYSLDIWGGVRRQIEGLQAQSEYQNFQLEAAFLTLSANVVTTAIQEAALRAQISTTEDMLRNQEKHLTMLEQQAHLGAIAETIVLTQQAELQQTRTTLPPLQQQLAQTRHRLSVLVGYLPIHDLPKQFQLSDLHLPLQLPVSLPAKLVQQRPDIRAQEALLHNSNAQIGVVNASILPDFTLSASMGSIATHIGDLFIPGSYIWNAGFNILQPVFKGGAFVHKRRAALAAYQAAAGQYKNTVLLAFQNVVDVLSALEFEAKQLQAQQVALNTATAQLNLLQQQFQLGAISYLPVLDAERNYQRLRLEYIKTQATQLADTAALFQALGGGWWNRPKLSPLNPRQKKPSSLFHELKQTFSKEPK